VLSPKHVVLQTACAIASTKTVALKLDSVRIEKGCFTCALAIQATALRKLTLQPGLAQQGSTNPLDYRKLQLNGGNRLRL
jgi:hypothetical protein